MTNLKATEPIFKPGASFKAINLEHGSGLDKLPCAVPWCAGHTTREAFEWSELTHTGEDVQLFPANSRAEGDVTPTLEGESGPARVNAYLRFEGELDLRGAHALAEELRRAADLIERTARLHPVVVAAGRIGGER